jgi:T5SS/PEP-CTERM-associated repeat protein
MGGHGSWNSLLVYGGTVAANYVYIGEEGGNNNRILLTGASSILYATNDFVCGSAGRASRVEILNGACLLDGRGGIGWETGADSNTVIVSGAGATWSNSYELYVGLQGSHNTLIVSNGGTVWSGGWTPIGQEFDSVGNTAIVTGPGSSWVTTNIFLIGERGRSNRLEIRNGGYVSNAWYAYIGESPGESSNAHGNSVLVTAPTRVGLPQHVEDGRRFRMEPVGGPRRRVPVRVQCVRRLGVPVVERQCRRRIWPRHGWTNTGMVYFGGFASVCAISNGPTVYSGELRSSGEDSNAPVRIVLDGTNTQWFCAGRVVVGLSSSYGFIVITNGARLTSAAGMIGQEGYDEGNSIVVTGPGSVWSNSGQVTVGNSGDDSSLIVDQGGKVFSAMRVSAITRRRLEFRARLGIEFRVEMHRQPVDGRQRPQLAVD